MNLKRIEKGKSGIHIKPENRGKFTALKKRTGKSASWFKAHGTPAQKKMATFALNARKWKHQDGGVISQWIAPELPKPEYQVLLEKFSLPTPYQSPYIQTYNGYSHIYGLTDITGDIAEGKDVLYSPPKEFLNAKFYKDDNGRYYQVDDVAPEKLPMMVDRSKLGQEVSYKDIKKLLPKRDYIGGNDSRLKVLLRIPGFTEEVYKKAATYGVDPNLILHRVMKEGFADSLIREYNNTSWKDQQTLLQDIWNSPVSGFKQFGLDDAGSNLLEGKYTLKDPEAKWKTLEEENENGRKVTSVWAEDLKSALEILAAEMAYRQKEVQRMYKPSSADLSTYVNAAFNRGLYHNSLKDGNSIRKEYNYPAYYSKYKLKHKQGGILKRVK